MTFTVRILGSSGALPAYDRHPTAQIIDINDRPFLVDCGEGTQMRLMEQDVRKGRIEHIFISHAHGDHYFGLPGLLSTYQLLSRTKPLHIYGPAVLEELIMIHLNPYKDQWSYKLEFHVVDPEESYIIYEDKEVEVHSIPLKHRIECTGFLFREKARSLNIISEKIAEYGLGFEDIKHVKAGNDFIAEDGRVVLNSEFTLPPHVPRSYAFCSDTAYHEPILPLIHQVDLLYHEATFMEESAERATLTGHSTASEAARIALQAAAGKLILGHFSAKYANLGGLLKEAKEVFAESYLAKEGEVFELPLVRAESHDLSA